MTITTSTMAIVTTLLSFIDVRCRHCNKMLFKWQPNGRTVVEVRCTRCSTTEVINLST
jgi:phage FluMu protein Com